MHFLLIILLLNLMLLMDNAILTYGDGRTCVVNITNNNNVGHIYGNVFPAVFASPYCATFIKKKSLLGSPLLKIMNELNFPFTVIDGNQLNSSTTTEFRSGSGFFYQRGFSTLKSKIADYISSTCDCEKEMYNITVFNRKTRGLNNYPRLLRSLEIEGLGPIRYFDSTIQDRQCWYFCKYITSRLVISVYGAESIYPFLLNTSFISVAYQGISDQFVNRIRRSYYSSFHPSMRQALVKASIVEEHYTKTCMNFWKNYSVYLQSLRSGQKPSPHMHKCLSLYLDDQVIADIIRYAKGILGMKSTKSIS